MCVLCGSQQRLRLHCCGAGCSQFTASGSNRTGAGGIGGGILLFMLPAAPYNPAPELPATPALPLLVAKN